MNERPSPLPVSATQLASVEQLAVDMDPTSLMWLSGYLAGIARVRGADPRGATATPILGPGAEVRRTDTTVRATVLYASQTGNGRRIAEKLSQSAEACGLAVRLISAADYSPRDLVNERLMLLIASTHGDGEAPDDLRAFLDHINGRRAPRLERLGFSVLALGDSSYPQFCATGRTLDSRLEALGARRIAPREELDVDYAASAAAWSERAIGLLKTELAELGAPRLTLVTNASRSAPPVGTPDQPLGFEVIVNQRITARDSDKDVRHIELAAPGEELPYEPGDALGVWPVNPPETVAAILESTGLSADTPVALDGCERTLGDWLAQHREVTRLARPLIEAQSQRKPDPELARLLAPEGKESLREALARWQVVDLLTRAPGAWDAASLVRALRPLTPRLYSIASSPLTVGTEVHLTVAAVDYRFEGAQRLGAASRHLATSADGTVRGYIEANPRFRLPADPDRDIIMVGPGTGVAPFRGFLQHRIAQSARGRNWLFFGARHLTSDFLYQTEWLAALKQGTLHRLDVAFSRDTAERVYVQQRMREKGAELWAWLESGAHLYVCGDAQHMAHDVHSALTDIVAVHGGKDPDSAAAYVESLLTERRYARDIY